MQRRVWLTLLAALAMLAALVSSAAAAAAPSAPTCTNPAVRCVTGTAGDGSTYKLEVPPNWNGTLLLYSHGYVPPVVPANPPAEDAPDRATADHLLSRGLALAGSSYAATGWAVEEAFTDQTDLLDTFADAFGPPARTVAWGTSMGGMITAGLAQRIPERLDGAVSMCGILGGAVGLWNQNLDLQFTLKTLLRRSADPAVAGAAEALELVGITDGPANQATATAAVTAAQQTPTGRARLALAAAVFTLPDWYEGLPEPAPGDHAAVQTGQYRWIQFQLPFVFNWRGEVEQRAGGNPSWNTGVDYAALLRDAPTRDTVHALYQQAGLDLKADLHALATAPRVSADRAVVDYLVRNVVYDGNLEIPLLTLHTTGDGLVVPAHPRAYADAVARAGRDDQLRQLTIHRPGHCTFTPAEQLTALNLLLERLDTGEWPRTEDPRVLNEQAAAYGPELNVLGEAPAAPAFTSGDPPPFPRPFDLAPPKE